MLITDTRAKYYSRLIEDCGSDQKALFKVINTLFQKDCNTQFPESESMDILAEEFSDFFITKIQRIRNKLDSLSVHTGHIDTVCQSRLDCFKALTEEDVRKLIQKSPCKSCDLDPMPTELLRKCLDLLIPVITRIINMSLAEGVFSSQFLCAIVFPLLKKLGLDLVFPSYRPVSNLAFLSKLSERAVAVHFVSYCQDYHLREQLQSSYTPYHSTETVLTKVHNDLLLAIDGKKVVLLDLSAQHSTRSTMQSYSAD